MLHIMSERSIVINFISHKEARKVNSYGKVSRWLSCGLYGIKERGYCVEDI